MIENAGRSGLLRTTLVKFGPFLGWFVATTGTVLFLLLLSRQSDSAVVFGRYSIDYAVLLVLFGVNVLLLWIHATRSSIERLPDTLGLRSILSLMVGLLCILFLFDLFLPLGLGPVHLVDLALIGGILLQIQVLGPDSLFLPRIALVGVSVVVGVVALELFFGFVLLKRVTPTNERELLELMRNPDYFGWTPWPRAIAEEKPRGTYRFIGLADSFGIWGGAESNYFRLLEKRLQADAPGPVELVNLSIDGYEPSHQLRILRLGVRYAPDLVVHGFFVGNDFTLNDDQIYKFIGFRARRSSADAPYRPHDFLLRRWADDVQGIRGERRAVEREKQAGIETGTFSRQTYLELQRGRLKHWGTPGEANLKRLKSVFPVLDEIRRVAEASGARYVLVVHPDQTQVDEVFRRELLATLGAQAADFDFDLPQRVMLEYCVARRVTCLDLLPTFRAHADKGDLYLLRDTHYNEAGRQLAANTIRDFLMTQSIRPNPK